MLLVYGLENQGILVLFPVRVEYLSLFLSVHIVCGLHIFIHWVAGRLSPRVKRLIHEGKTSPRASTEVKKAWSLTCTPPYAFMACTGIILHLIFVKNFFTDVWCLKLRITLTFNILNHRQTKIHFITYAAMTVCVLRQDKHINRLKLPARVEVSRT